MSNYFTYILQLFGISITENTNPYILLLSVIIFFTFIALLSVLNISIYLFSIYIINTNKVLYNFLSKYPYLLKIVNYYKSSRIVFILIEVLFLLFSLLYIIYLCYRVIFKLL